METLVWGLLRHEWKDPGVQKNGRTGQSQHGVDIYGRPNQGDNWSGAQVKNPGRPHETGIKEQELVAEIENAKNFTPSLSEYLFISSGPSDAKIQELARKITSEHLEHGLFSVEVWGWDEVQRRLAHYPDLIQLYYPQFYRPERTEPVSADFETARPRFEVIGSGWTLSEQQFTPSLRLKQFSGDPVADIEWKFTGPRFHMPWRQVSGYNLEKTPVSQVFDLSQEPPGNNESPDLELNELGLDIRFHWRGQRRRELHKWPLNRRELGNDEIHWEVGAEIRPPSCSDD